MSSKLLSILVLPVLRSQVKCSVNSMRISNCQGIWAVSEILAAFCFLRAKRRFGKLWSWMLHPPPSQAWGGDSCFLRACYFRRLHDLYISASLVGGIACHRRAENNLYMLIYRFWYLLAHVEKFQIESHDLCLADALGCTDGAMVGWSWNVQGRALARTAVTCTAQPPRLGSHDCFAKIGSHKQRKNPYLEQYAVPCGIIELDGLPLTSVWEVQKVPGKVVAELHLDVWVLLIRSSAWGNSAVELWSVKLLTPGQVFWDSLVEEADK